MSHIIAFEVHLTLFCLLLIFFHWFLHCAFNDAAVDSLVPSWFTSNAADG